MLFKGFCKDADNTQYKKIKMSFCCMDCSRFDSCKNRDNCQAEISCNQCGKCAGCVFNKVNKNEL